MKAFEEIVEIFYLLKFIEIEITDIINVIKNNILLITKGLDLLIKFTNNLSGYFIPYQTLTWSGDRVIGTSYSQLPKILTSGLKNASKNIHRWINYVNIRSCNKINKNPKNLKIQRLVYKENSLHTEIKYEPGNYIVQLFGGDYDREIVGSCEIDVRETIALVYSYIKNSLEIKSGCGVIWLNTTSLLSFQN